MNADRVIVSGGGRSVASEATSVFALRMRDNVDLFYVCVWSLESVSLGVGGRDESVRD